MCTPPPMPFAACPQVCSSSTSSTLRFDMEGCCRGCGGIVLSGSCVQSVDQGAGSWGMVGLGRGCL